MNRALTAGGTLSRERSLLASAATSIIFIAGGDQLWARLGGGLALWLVALWVFVIVLGGALAVVRHAEKLAEHVGEPYGTLVLTLAVTVIEVTSISGVMLRGENNPTLARDTLFAVVMIILNGMVGLSLLIGAWRYREQSHNLQGANVYLGVTVPLVALSLILPDFTRTTPGATLSVDQEIFLVLVSIGLYIVFLLIQTGRHRNYFELPGGSDPTVGHRSPGGAAKPALLLVANLLPALFLAEQLAFPVDYLIETAHAPVALGGVVLAVLVATPEAIGAVRAALANQLQRSVNIFLGSILSTIGLTVPLMVIVSLVTGRTLVLGVQGTDLVMLLLTIFVSTITFSSGRTNVVQGLVHLILFAAYLLLIIQG